MDPQFLKKEFLSKYLLEGHDKFYKTLLLNALNKLVLINKDNYQGPSPNIELLDWHDQFIILYRREGEDNYLKIAQIFRKAAHKIYRIMLKKNMTTYNPRFLNLV